MMRLSFGLAVSFALSGCGGSSSETPPPLQPDPTGFHYAGVPASKHEDLADAGDNDNDNDSDVHKPKRPAANSAGEAFPNK